MSEQDRKETPLEIVQAPYLAQLDGQAQIHLETAGKFLTQGDTASVRRELDQVDKIRENKTLISETFRHFNDQLETIFFRLSALLHGSHVEAPASVGEMIIRYAEAYRSLTEPPSYHPTPPEEKAPMKLIEPIPVYPAEPVVGQGAEVVQSGVEVSAEGNLASSGLEASSGNIAVGDETDKLTTEVLVERSVGEPLKNSQVFLSAKEVEKMIGLEFSERLGEVYELMVNIATTQHRGTSRDDVANYFQKKGRSATPSNCVSAINDLTEWLEKHPAGIHVVKQSKGKQPGTWQLEPTLPKTEDSEGLQGAKSSPPGTLPLTETSIQSSSSLSSGEKK